MSKRLEELTKQANEQMDELLKLIEVGPSVLPIETRAKIAEVLARAEHAEQMMLSIDFEPIGWRERIEALHKALTPQTVH